MAHNISSCNDTSDLIEFFEPQKLYLKPVAKINVSVQLPLLKTHTKSISNWEVMEKLRIMIKPDEFQLLKVVKSTLEFVRFEGEVENKTIVKVLICKLDSKTMKLSGFPDLLKIRAAEAKIPFPTRHAWDSWFREAKFMNELKPGERPDTIHIKDLPTRWFASRKDKDKSRPNEYVFKKVFETFGEIRAMDIPLLDPYRGKTISDDGAIQTFSFGQDLTFEAWVQYKEYVGFVKAMTDLKGMKLVYRSDENKAHAATIKIDFDKSQHLTEKSIRKRRINRERLERIEIEKEEKRKALRLAEEQRIEEERKRKEELEKEKERRREERLRLREERQQERETKRRKRKLEKQQLEEEQQMAMKIAKEERRILVAQRKLETIRLLSEIFQKIKVKLQQEDLIRREHELEEERRKQLQLQAERRAQDAAKRRQEAFERRHRMQREEQDLRDRILKNMRVHTARREERQRENLRKKLSGSTKLKSAVVMNTFKERVIPKSDRE